MVLKGISHREFIGWAGKGLPQIHKFILPQMHKFFGGAYQSPLWIAKTYEITHLEDSKASAVRLC